MKICRWWDLDWQEICSFSDWDAWFSLFITRVTIIIGSSFVLRSYNSLMSIISASSCPHRSYKGVKGIQVKSIGLFVHVLGWAKLVGYGFAGDQSNLSAKLVGMERNKRKDAAQGGWTIVTSIKCRKKTTEEKKQREKDAAQGGWTIVTSIKCRKKTTEVECGRLSVQLLRLTTSYSGMDRNEFIEDVNHISFKAAVVFVLGAECSFTRQHDPTAVPMVTMHASTIA
ncbi:hypothetical protein Tco_0927623 [Tanacetum coccineum]